MDTRAPITISVPVWITKNDPDDDYMDWLRGKLKEAGWDERRTRDLKGPIAISMRIACPAPPAGLSGRKAAGGTVWRGNASAAGASGEAQCRKGFYDRADRTHRHHDRAPLNASRDLEENCQRRRYQRMG